MIYFIEAQDWAKAANVKLFYFSSFDETWKIRFEGGVGTSWRLGM
jgi:GPH family glycoside/pentoside/hexuronide:cation symporter